MIENLTTNEKDTALRFFLYHMTQDIRGRFMAEMPTIYAHAFPTVDAAILLGKVGERIAQDRGGRPTA